MGCLFCSSFDLKTSGKGALILGLISICVQVDLIFDTLFESEGAIRSSLGHRLASERFSVQACATTSSLQAKRRRPFACVSNLQQRRRRPFALLVFGLRSRT